MLSLPLLRALPWAYGALAGRVGLEGPLELLGRVTGPGPAGVLQKPTARETLLAKVDEVIRAASGSPTSAT